MLFDTPTINYQLVTHYLIIFLCRYDRITTKAERPLAMTNRLFHYVSTTDDPIIRELAKEGHVFATDSILATIMTCPRSYYSWDIIIQRVGSRWDSLFGTLPRFALCYLRVQFLTFKSGFMGGDKVIPSPRIPIFLFRAGRPWYYNE